MADNRVQKLLFSEYCDFEDMVLIESPFAQTTKDGEGIRQVHLGLTPSKLVLATDVLPPVEYVNFKYAPGVDPEIETFELVAIYPVECVNLSIYKTKKNQALKARFCNNRVLYFELGGFEHRAMFWNLWCERIKFLCPDNSGSSRSETSVGTSTTGSTLYLVDKKLVAVNGYKQLWCTFGMTPSLVENISNKMNYKNGWMDRNIYLGKYFENYNYAPIVQSPTIEEFVKTPKSSKLGLATKQSDVISYMDANELKIGDCVQINRFGNGIDEGCNIRLFLTADDYVPPQRFSLIDKSSLPSISAILNYEHLAETAVLAWEFFRVSDPQKYKIKHRRRYGLTPESNFHFGLGPLNISKGDKYSVQVKKVVSSVCLLSKERTCVKKHLTASISQQFVSLNKRKGCNFITNNEKTPITLFWTPCYKYRPQSAKLIYRGILKDLKSIKDYHESIKYKKKKNYNFFRRFYQNKQKINSDEESEEEYFKTKRRKKHGFIHTIFPNSVDVSDVLDIKKNETPLQCLKRQLELDKYLSIWDFDSTALAQHLTMIDKDLFLKISSMELDTILWQQSSTNTPNINALIIFSERIRNLFAFEILKNDNNKDRARLIARLVNVADKCHKISNYQSCRTVLASLQSPAVYRLKDTWAYVRKKHGSKYQTFEFLCRFYRDPRLATYQKTFYMVAQNPPFLPYIGDVLGKLLGKIPDYPPPFNLSLSRTPSCYTTTESRISENVTNVSKCPPLINKLLKLFTLSDANDATVKTKKVRKRYPTKRKKIKFKGLYEYYKPLDCYEDCREINLEITREFLEKSQLGAMCYNFRTDDLVNCYLLKARYQDEQQNFNLSLSIESPRNYYEPNFNKL
ncbi:uncharacterized protein LOC130453206 [Diorhabda sublineata]|uniref:uncharacterized protein LOC130453206 n=1 Tax=Diorhabda sublineata TaxID=1163346 RepID=UPI0024E08824|nr:uncharacterized protein LOC130453206 [Diorhabda sublineata]